MPDVGIQAKHFLSDKVEHFTESVIREMTRQATLSIWLKASRIFPHPPTSNARHSRPSPRM
jgi:hypothetical protein